MPTREPPTRLGLPLFPTRRVRVVNHRDYKEPVYRIEKRSRWWPFWNGLGSALYMSREGAIEAAKAELAVGDYLRRTVHEMDVVWQG